MYTSMYGCEQAPSWPVTEQWPCDKPEGLFAFGMFYWVTYKLSPNPNPNLTGGPSSPSVCTLVGKYDLVSPNPKCAGLFAFGM